MGLKELIWDFQTHIDFLILGKPIGVCYISMNTIKWIQACIGKRIKRVIKWDILKPTRP
jgi:hypothetical protein